MDDDRKTYYVAVGAGQILEDPTVAPFEFAIRANDEELNKLQDRFEDLSSADETTAFRYADWVSGSDKEMLGEYDRQMRGIYSLLYELGTEETKRHIESAGLLEED
ncbi:hypothetical protein [Cohnella nanjingensis]|uniref:Hydrolase n=1 Tax=Cohnella nanjingensis TaxID=1387779 RepID=A0A7X0RRE4_9BACL|nr:hypothetical protein [Cohnella nanjingensis]MBB6672312.1 hypothetical protein [Cohnella nanjingensis]